MRQRERRVEGLVLFLPVAARLSARTGVSLNGFEGGQLPIYRRLPKRGFVNPFRKVYAPLNLGGLDKAIADGRLPADQPIDEAMLQAAGVVRSSRSRYSAGARD